MFTCRGVVNVRDAKTDKLPSLKSKSHYLFFFIFSKRALSLRLNIWFLLLREVKMKNFHYVNMVITALNKRIYYNRSRSKIVILVLIVSSPNFYYNTFAERKIIGRNLFLHSKRTSMPPQFKKECKRNLKRNNILRTNFNRDHNNIRNFPSVITIILGTKKKKKHVKSQIMFFFFFCSKGR